MRARYPDTEGFAERDGVKVAYEVFGSGSPALVFMPIVATIGTWAPFVTPPAETDGADRAAVLLAELI